MKGWKTWVAALGAIALGVYEVIDGHIVFGGGMIGLGHKIEKAAA